MGLLDRLRDDRERSDWKHLRGRFARIQAHDDEARPDVVPGEAPEPGHQTHTPLRDQDGGYADGSATDMDA